MLQTVARRAFGMLVILMAVPAAPQVAASAIVRAEGINPHPSYPQGRGSMLVGLADGTLPAAWFGGSEEGANGVVRLR